MCFSVNVGHHFLKSNNIGRHFCTDFQRFCSDFQGFRPDFQQIKTFGVALAPPSPTPLLCAAQLIHVILVSTISCQVWRLLWYRNGSLRETFHSETSFTCSACPLLQKTFRGEAVLLVYSRQDENTLSLKLIFCWSYQLDVSLLRVDVNLTAKWCFGWVATEMLAIWRWNGSGKSMTKHLLCGLFCKLLYVILFERIEIFVERRQFQPAYQSFFVYHHTSG